MTDNVNINDRLSAAVIAATDQLSDNAQSPKVTLMKGDSSLTQIWPAQSLAEDAAHVSGDGGTMALTVREDTPVSTAGTTGDYAALITGPDGLLWVRADVRKSTIATPANVAGSVTSVLLLAANTDRIGGSIINDSAAILYILLGSGAASTTNYSYVLDAKTTIGNLLEIPSDWKGAIQGIWATAVGAARVTERTP
jgi:hypothetical protein